MTDRGTPVDVWAPAWWWLPASRLAERHCYAGFSRTGVGRWCRMCELDVPHAEEGSHARRHADELAVWRAEQRASEPKEGT